MGLLLLFLLLFTSAYAADPIDTLVRGNQLYEKGDLQAAAQLYEQLVAQGVADGTLYYNLGNAYYKQGELGQAILNYTRAARLMPRDEEIRTNLALAQSQLVDQYENDGESPIGGLLTWLRTWLTLNELALLALGLWFLSVFCWLLYRHVGRGRGFVQQAFLISLLLLLGSGAVLGGILYNEKSQPPAIVLAREIKVVSGPGEQYNTEFTLHQGAQVSLLETRGEWARIGLPGGQMQGWLPVEKVEAVEQ